MSTPCCTRTAAARSRECVGGLSWKMRRDEEQRERLPAAARGAVRRDASSAAALGDDVPGAVAGAEADDVAVMDDAAARFLDREHLEISYARARRPQRPSAAAHRLHVVVAVARAERDAVAGDQRSTRQIDNTDDFPSTRTRRTSIGTDARAATALRHHVMRAVVRAQDDARLQRRNEIPFRFGIRAQPILEERR